jgi:hypothetical protein
MVFLLVERGVDAEKKRMRRAGRGFVFLGKHQIDYAVPSGYARNKQGRVVTRQLCADPDQPNHLHGQIADRIPKNITQHETATGACGSWDFTRRYREGPKHDMHMISILFPRFSLATVSIRLA